MYEDTYVQRGEVICVVIVYVIDPFMVLVKRNLCCVYIFSVSAYM